MLVHLGRGTSVHGEKLIALTDIQRRLAMEIHALVERFRQDGLVRSLGDSPKTLVICREDARCVCYLSCVGLRALRKRMKSGS